MDKAEKTMIENLQKNTGKTLEEWITIVNQQKFAKHGEKVKYLKEKHSFTHVFAILVALKAKGLDAGSVENKDDLIEKQYNGKELLKSIYNKLLAEILKFGKDVEVALKKSYASLRREKQFAILQPATKTRFEIGLNIKGQQSNGKLEIISSSNAMCSHKINQQTNEDIDKEVIKWIKTAYKNAG
jgi:predicted transport protein